MQKRKPWHSVEALQSRKLSHPGVMRTYKHLIVLVQAYKSPLSRDSPLSTGFNVTVLYPTVTSVPDLESLRLGRTKDQGWIYSMCVC